MWRPNFIQLVFLLMAPVTSSPAAELGHSGESQVFYAEELIVDNTMPNNGFDNGADGNDAEVLNFSHDLLTSLTANTDYYFRYELRGGASWPPGLQPADFKIQACLGATPIISASTLEYRDNNKTLLFSLTVPANTTCRNTNTARVALPSSGFAQGEVPDKTGLSITYRVYDIQSIANQGLTSGLGVLAGIDKADYIDFTRSALTANAETMPETLIDANQGGVSFQTSTAGSSKTAICAFSLYETPDVRNATGAVLRATSSVIEVVDVGTRLVINGDFSATGLKTSKVWLDENSFCNGAMSTAYAEEVTPEQAIINLDQDYPRNQAGTASPEAPVYVCMEVDGLTPLQPTEYSLRYEPASAEGYEVLPISLDCGEIRYGGSHAKVVMVVNPFGASYTQYIRITNPSQTDGEVYIRAYNDRGEKSPDIWSFSLPAQASTGMITPEMLARHTGISLPTDQTPETGSGHLNKIRLILTASFGRDGKNSAVQVRSYVVSRDNASFNFFE